MILKFKQSHQQKLPSEKINSSNSLISTFWVRLFLSYAYQFLEFGPRGLDLPCVNNHGPHPLHNYERNRWMLPYLAIIQFVSVAKSKNTIQLRLQFSTSSSTVKVPVVVNLKHIFELFGFCNTCFLIQKLLELIRLSSDGQFWRKSRHKKGGKFELRLQLCYYNCKRA